MKKRLLDYEIDMETRFLGNDLNRPYFSLDINDEYFEFNSIEEFQEFRSRVVSLLDGAIKLYGDVMTLKK